MKLEDKLTKQSSGAQSNIEFQKKYRNIEEAKEAYQQSKKKLLNINNWHHIAGLFSGKFTLTDEKGNEINSIAREGLFFKIKLPVPSMIGSDGYDWVRVEEIYEELSNTNEWIILKVKPVSNPQNHDKETAHFFTGAATSNFCVERKHTILKASVYGRNEKPNIHTYNLFNKIRNWVIGKFAMIGFNTPQWKGLVKGLILHR